MNDLQQIYLVFFSIFFAIMLYSVKELAPFKTSLAHIRQVQKRLGVSIFVLNVAPIIYFIYFLTSLENSNFQFSEFLGNIIPIVTVFALSLSVYGFQQFWFAIINGFQESLFTQNELFKIKFVKNLEFFWRHPNQNLYPAIYYVLIPTIFFYYMSNQISSLISIIGFLIIITFGWVLITRKYSAGLSKN